MRPPASFASVKAAPAATVIVDMEPGQREVTVPVEINLEPGSGPVTLNLKIILRPHH